MTDMTTYAPSVRTATINAIEWIAEAAPKDSRNALLHGLDRDIKLGRQVAIEGSTQAAEQHIRVLEALRRLVGSHPLLAKDFANLTVDPAKTVVYFLEAASACSAREMEWLMKAIRRVQADSGAAEAHVAETMDQQLRSLNWA